MHMLRKYFIAAIFKNSRDLAYEMIHGPIVIRNPSVD